MASILTNTSAMVALQNLRTINSNLVDTQNQIATGRKIATAKDNSLFLIRRPEEPHHQEERHHRSDEIGVGHFPGAAMMTASNDLLALDDNGRFGFSGHTTTPHLPPNREPIAPA